MGKEIKDILILVSSIIFIMFFTIVFLYSIFKKQNVQVDEITKKYEEISYQYDLLNNSYEELKNEYERVIDLMNGTDRYQEAKELQEE